MPVPERQFIAELRRRQERQSRQVVVGIGDDCAILHVPARHEMLLTTDFSLEGVHFRREWQSPECIGHRCLARGLSDIAAMGGHPSAIFLSLAVPSTLAQRWIDRFISGLLRLASRFQVNLAGGDTSTSPSGVLADIVVLGSIQRGRALLRSGASPGDRIYVTGKLGKSAAALHWLKTGAVKRSDVFPVPRIGVGEWLSGKSIASAAIDISDGLSTDLSHMCEESGVGAIVDVEAIPVDPTLRKFTVRPRDIRKVSSQSPLRRDREIELALHGGEDYELLFTAPANKTVPSEIGGVLVTCIGEIVRGKKMTLIQKGNQEELVPKGWEHFR